MIYKWKFLTSDCKNVLKSNKGGTNENQLEKKSSMFWLISLAKQGKVLIKVSFSDQLSRLTPFC